MSLTKYTAEKQHAIDVVNKQISELHNMIVSLERLREAIRKDDDFTRTLYSKIYANEVVQFAKPHVEKALDSCHVTAQVKAPYRTKEIFHQNREAVHSQFTELDYFMQQGC